MADSLMDLKETEIRPDDLMQKQAELYAADVERLVAASADFVHVACPACGSDTPRLAFRKYSLSYQHCETCETVYVSPRPTPQHLETYYQTSQNYEFWNRYIFPASEEARRLKIFKPRAERIVDICSRFEVGRNTLIEVGPGFGLFCEELGRMGAFQRIIGVEPTPGLAETCRKRGVEVIEQRVEDVRFDDLLVDAIVSFEVIEHLFSPREFVERCASPLSPGGVLVLTCPNIKGFDIDLLREVSDSVDAEHLNYFHPESLSDLVTSCGFEVLEVSTPGKLDAELVRKKVLAGQFSLQGHGFLQKVLIDDWDRLGPDFQQYLADHCLSSHMWLVARKPQDASHAG